MCVGAGLGVEPIKLIFEWYANSSINIYIYISFYYIFFIYFMEQNGVLCNMEGQKDTLHILKQLCNKKILIMTMLNTII